MYLLPDVTLVWLFYPQIAEMPDHSQGWHWVIQQVVFNSIGWTADLKTGCFSKQEIKVLLHFAFPYWHTENDRVSLLIHLLLQFWVLCLFPKVFFSFPDFPRSQGRSWCRHSECILFVIESFNCHLRELMQLTFNTAVSLLYLIPYADIWKERKKLPFG